MIQHSYRMINSVTQATGGDYCLSPVQKNPINTAFQLTPWISLIYSQ